ncbi:TRAP transporter substrate-binding protein [Microbacterium protaetiae]|uniref:TRAP transporter substrate-binding protein n=1 Tax=Microbacterium protaetiae TaxID=2509458 RepID=A0A4P6EEU1_9MICO|nr:TRAP transporter substrate-binding protein [Microbacterium protaetiae]QAY59903.1 TRAP transporter substrate-binding protein [Microbacterium protaetiae]
MRTKTRITLLATTAVAALSLAACSGGVSGDDSATTHTMKLALNQAQTHPSFIALEKFGEDLKAATDGRWDIQVYPDGQLGPQDEYVQQVSTGTVDLAIVSAPQLENYNDDFVVFSLPTVFDSIDQQMDIFANKDVVGDLYTSLEKDNNVTVVGGLTQGARSIYLKDKIAQTPADLKGKKIRVQPSEVFVKMMEAFGASPTPMDFSEVYTGLQSGAIDGAENNEISYLSTKHYEVAPYFSFTRHLIGADFLVINTKTLNEMSDADRGAFDDGWESTWKNHTEIWKTDTDKAIADAKAEGATFAEVDNQAFLDVLTPVVPSLLKTDSQKALYDSIKAAEQ